MFSKCDKVLYIPSINHALDIGPFADDKHAWVIGRKVRRPKQGGGFTEEVEELEGLDLINYLDAIQKQPNSDELKRNMVFVRPRHGWVATVKEVHDDGTVDLDIQAPNPCITLHYKKVPISPRLRASNTPYIPSHTPHTVTIYSEDHTL